MHRGVLEALAYAKSLAPNRLLAVTVVSDEEEQERIEQQWAERGIDVPLEIVHSPYRELTRPILRFIDELDARYENDIITVVLPEFVVASWWGQLLHNQSALFLKGRLLFRKGTVVTSVPYHLESDERPKDGAPTGRSRTAPLDESLCSRRSRPPNAELGLISGRRGHGRVAPDLTFGDRKPNFPRSNLSWTSVENRPRGAEGHLPPGRGRRRPHRHPGRAAGPGARAPSPPP